MTGLVERIAAKVPSWGVRLAYGEKTVIDGVELLPVAFVGFGFGAGQGSAPEGDGAAEQDAAGGGGGGGWAFPLGVYSGEGGSVRFRPNPLTLAMAAAPLVGAIGAAVASIVLAARRH